MIMNLLRSFLMFPFLLLTLFYSALILSAELTVVPGWDVYNGTEITGSEFNFPTGAASYAGFSALDSYPHC